MFVDCFMQLEIILSLIAFSAADSFPLTICTFGVVWFLK